MLGQRPNSAENSGGPAQDADETGSLHSGLLCELTAVEHCPHIDNKQQDHHILAERCQRRPHNNRFVRRLHFFKVEGKTFSLHEVEKSRRRNVIWRFVTDGEPSCHVVKSKLSLE